MLVIVWVCIAPGVVGVRGFKDKLTYWAAYNAVLRSNEHKAKILQDAQSFVQYYERQRQFLISCAGSSVAVYPWLAEVMQQDVSMGLDALRQRGLRMAESQIKAGKAAIGKMMLSG